MQQIRKFKQNKKTSNIRRLLICNNILAGDEGFEPPIMGPEPTALPLGQSPIFWSTYVIIPNITPYFQPLAATILQWYL